MTESTLLRETRDLLSRRRVSLRKISADTGINYHWLGKFAQGVIEDPGVNKVEQLHRFLTDEGSRPAA